MKSKLPGCRPARLRSLARSSHARLRSRLRADGGCRAPTPSRLPSSQKQPSAELPRRYRAGRNPGVPLSADQTPAFGSDEAKASVSPAGIETLAARPFRQSQSGRRRACPCGDAVASDPDRGVSCWDPTRPFSLQWCSALGLADRGRRSASPWLGGPGQSAAQRASDPRSCQQSSAPAAGSRA
jgi:hypothetical protein